MVEYVLLLVVVVSIAAGLMNSDAFKRFVGEDSELMQKMVRQMTYAYRHGRLGELDESDYERTHETYFNKDEDRSRFFTPTETYP